METKDRCKIEIKSSKNGDDYEIKMKGNCSEEMDIIEKLPERRREYLKRRIIYTSENSSI